MKNNFIQKINATLKGKLSMWYLSSTAFIFLFFTIAVSGLFLAVLQNQIDHHIHIAVNEAHQIVKTYHGDERNSLIKTLVSAQGMTVVVLSPDGSAILETNSPDIALPTEHQLQKILSVAKPFESTPIHFTENNIRFAAKPVQMAAGNGIVAVGYSTKILYSSFYKMLLVLAGIIIFLILPATFMSYKILKKQLQPLESISKQAKEVSDFSSLAKRIKILNPTKEL